MLIEVSTYRYANRQCHETQETALRTVHDWIATYGGPAVHCPNLAKMVGTSSISTRHHNANALRRKLVNEFNPLVLTARQAAVTICASSMLSALDDAYQRSHEVGETRDPRFEVPREMEEFLLALAEGRRRDDHALRSLADQALARLGGSAEDDTVRDECLFGNVGCMALAWTQSHTLVLGETMLDQTF